MLIKVLVPPHEPWYTSIPAPETLGRQSVFLTTWELKNERLRYSCFRRARREVQKVLGYEKWECQKGIAPGKGNSSAGGGLLGALKNGTRGVQTASARVVRVA